MCRGGCPQPPVLGNHEGTFTRQPPPPDTRETQKPETVLFVGAATPPWQTLICQGTRGRPLPNPTHRRRFGKSLNVP